MTTRSILIQGAIGRAIYGTLALLFPKPLFATLRIDAEADARYFNRLFGGRDLVIAGATVAALRAGQESQAITVNLLCEATDTFSFIEELRARGGFDRALAIGLAFNVAGYATWLRALVADKR